MENKTGVQLIAEERQRQIEEEGYNSINDAFYINGELSMAAALYALPEAKRHDDIKAFVWPWDRKHWKPDDSDRIKELKKAGALIAAEIDRLKQNQ